MDFARRLVLIAAALFVSAGLGWGQQSSSWRFFRVSDGLPESFVTSVSISQRTNVWVKHFEVNAITSLSGYKTKTMPAPYSGQYRIHEGRAGQIWAVQSGGLYEYRNGTWVFYPVKEIQQE